MSDAWKNHERKVAEHFGVKRRVRGADFGQMDIEILVDPGEYLYFDSKANTVPIFVECKYRKSLGIVDLFKEHYKNTHKAIPILKIGTYLFCDLDDFPFLYHWIESIYINDTQNIMHLALFFNIKTLNIKLPNYISEYINQAKSYRTKISTYNNAIPLACVTSYKSNHRVVCINMNDVLTSPIAYENKLII